MNKKEKTAGISILSNVFLIVSKIVVGIFTNSISIISEAIHSFMDLLAAVIAFFSVKKASQPADDRHQYGHGKFEEASGLAEGALILIAAGLIIHESFGRLISGQADYIDSVAGIVVMLLSVVVNIFVSQNLYRVAKETDSMALFADAEHLRTDVLTSAGVLIGLILIKFTGLKILDPIIAIFVAILIIKVGVELCISSMRNLLDISLPEEDINIIKEVLTEHSSNKIISYTNLKTRKAGSEKLIEFTLIMPRELTLEEAHQICDQVEDELGVKMPNTLISIHAEPFNGD